MAQTPFFMITWAEDEVHIGPEFVEAAIEQALLRVGKKIRVEVTELNDMPIDCIRADTKEIKATLNEVFPPCVVCGRRSPRPPLWALNEEDQKAGPWCSRECLRADGGPYYEVSDE
jgi:hypothetical protein